MLVDEAIDYLKNLKKQREEDQKKRVEEAVDYLKGLEPKNYNDDVKTYRNYLCFKCGERKRTISVIDENSDFIKKCCDSCREKHGFKIWKMEEKWKMKLKQ